MNKETTLPLPRPLENTMRQPQETMKPDLWMSSKYDQACSNPCSCQRNSICAAHKHLHLTINKCHTSRRRRWRDGGFRTFHSRCCEHHINRMAVINGYNQCKEVEHGRTKQTEKVEMQNSTTNASSKENPL